MRILRESADVLGANEEGPGGLWLKEVAARQSVNDYVSKLLSWRQSVPRPLLALSLGTYVATLLAFIYAPSAVSQRVFGTVNVAYLLALSQFAITFFVAVAYSISARRVADPLVDDIHAMLDEQIGASHA
ncbi:DUF485 domain-containing protein [Burkholderia multivorans]|uniref:DUF485 domain-containing protein n=1 Tax=Burkholderia multivorans TaxID=87883 RepID=UPI001C2317A9|nr:DUF485 domain-containing protein [Burkholderia multivorans]MBU9477061.1 DUF485 domain-containing protein [Burkholderia multivorans]